MYRLSKDEREFLREEKQARQAWKKKFRKITIEHLPDLPEYRNASPLGKLRMKIYYLIVIDERGEFTIPYSSEAHDILLSIDEEAESLMKLSREERLAYFKRMDKLNSMNFTMDMGTTVLHINTFFDEKNDETVVDTVRRVTQTN